MSKITIPVPFLVLFTEINLARLFIMVEKSKSEVIDMVMLCFGENSYREDVVLPGKDLYLTCVYCDQVRKYFLCMASVDPDAKPIRVRIINGDLSPVLKKYTALPYKRQSSIEYSSVRSILLSKIESFGFPFFYDYDNYEYVRLDKMKNFYSKIRRHYVVVASRKEDNEEKVAFLFDNYSEAAYVSRYFRSTEFRDLLAGNFEVLNAWYPYLWVEYMGHPICLFSVISSYSGCYSLGSDWCYYLVCFLKNGFIPEENLSSVFGFVYKDKLSQIFYRNK